MALVENHRIIHDKKPGCHLFLRLFLPFHLFRKVFFEVRGYYLYIVVFKRFIPGLGCGRVRRYMDYP